MIARTPLTRTIGFALLGVFALLIVAMLVRGWQGEETVLLTWPPFWECFLAFVIGATAGAVVVAVLARPLGQHPARQALGVLGVIGFGGAIAVARLCWWVEVMTFNGQPIAIEQAQFILVHADLDTKGSNYGKTTLSVTRDGYGQGVAVPVPRILRSAWRLPL